MTISAIYRYPVKGLSPERLDEVTLSAGLGVPHDRRFALALAATQIDPGKPEWLHKSSFFMLMRDAQLAQLQTRFDERSGSFTIARAGKLLLSASIADADGRGAIEAFFAEFLAGHPGGRPKLVEAPGHSFYDARQRPNSTTNKYISIINLASIEDLERAAQVPLDPLRFRANLYFSGTPAWSELTWVDSDLTIGTAHRRAHLRVVSPITRCPATSVNPATAARDLDIPQLLQREFGHNTMGIYAEVVAGGVVATNDPLSR
jgi:uncharacterized protein YcbX